MAKKTDKPHKQFELPDWAAETRTRLSQFQWLDKAEEETDTMRSRYAEGESFPMGVLWWPSVWEFCIARAQQHRVVARGPALPGRSGVETHPLLFIAETDAAEFFLSIGADIPPAFWIPAGRTAESVQAALAEFIPTPSPRRHTFQRRLRALMGYATSVKVPHVYSGEWVPAHPHELDRWFVFSPFVCPDRWGTAFTDDPWRQMAEKGERLLPLQKTMLSEEFFQPFAGGVPTALRRTAYSQSYVGYEMHQENIYVWDIHYNPGKHPRVIEQLNQLMETDYLTDLPLDVVGTIMGLGWTPADELSRGLEKATGTAVIPYLNALTALHHSDLLFVQNLRRYLKDEAVNVRITLYNLALAYNYEWLLEEAILLEKEQELLDHITALLFRRMAPPRMTRLGEPANWDDGAGYGDDDSEDDDDSVEER